MLTIRLLATIAALLPLLSFGQSRFLEDPAEVREVSEGIVASVSAGNFAGAVKELRPIAVIPATDFDVFEAQFNSQQATLLRQFGEAEGYEFAREDKAGTRLVRLQYLVFHKNAPIRWLFVFYKSQKGWVLSHFSFEGNAIGYFPALLGGV